MAIKQKHLYCADCKGHFFEDRWWSQEEWDKWINAFESDVVSDEDSQMEWDKLS